MASLRLLPSVSARSAYFATSPSCAKQEADRQERQKSWQAERCARGNLRKIFERLERAPITAG